MIPRRFECQCVPAVSALPAGWLSRRASCPARLHFIAGALPVRGCTLTVHRRNAESGAAGHRIQPGCLRRILGQFKGGCLIDILIGPGDQAPDAFQRGLQLVGAQVFSGLGHRLPGVICQLVRTLGNHPLPIPLQHGE